MIIKTKIPMMDFKKTHNENIYIISFWHGIYNLSSNVSI